MSTTHPRRTTRRARRCALAVAAAATGAALLAACGSSAGTGQPASVATAADGPVDASGYAWGHVHNLAVDGQRLLIGTHHGVFSQTPGSAPVLASKDAFDVMGLVRTPSGWLASGHPSADQEGPSDLGLLSSKDAATWTTISLADKADFHRLVASGQTVLGVNSADGHLLHSSDGGKSWMDMGAASLFDLAIDPANPATIVASTEKGPVRSTGAEVSWTPLAGAPLVAFLAWDGATLYGVDATGGIWASTDAGQTWIQTGTAGGQPGALAASNGTLAVLVGDTISTSRDGGRTFTKRITGIVDEQH
jgi:hypothetical protein